MTDAIIKNMNQMAHSVDDIFRTSDLNEILRLSTALAERTANRHRVKLKFRPAESKISVTTAPFFLINLIWLCLTAIFQIGDKERTVTISAEWPQGKNIRIRMQLNEFDPDATVNYSVPSGLELLTGSLNADVEWKGPGNELLIYLPTDLTSNALSDDLTTMLKSSFTSDRSEQTI
jgi:hypothetical protein